jgi:plasmid stabilization system protein ParE
MDSPGNRSWLQRRLSACPEVAGATYGTLAEAEPGRSDHSLIVEAVERHADYEEQMRSLVKEALAADEGIEKTGEVYAARDVHAWMGRLPLGELCGQAVASVVYSGRSLGHIERAFGFLRDKNPEAALNAVVAIQSAVDMLAMHPLIGRRVEGELRELVISYGQAGYVALYRL